VPGSIDYRQPGPLTELGPGQVRFAGPARDDPVSICALAQGLVIQPWDATAAGVSDERLGEKNVRRARDLLLRLGELGPRELDVARAPHERVVGTCRHFALLATALLRHASIPARARCGFATYFFSGKGVDHWVIEYWSDEARRWGRVDTEILGTDRVPDPSDLADGAFLTGGEAWALWRDGAIDPGAFGVAGVAHAWGIGEIRGNAIRDLASLAKLEMLPWDEWGRMTDSYRGSTGDEFDALIDDVARACASDDPDEVTRLYQSADLAVPSSMIV
jgi:Transglutaminase-like superfamily